jgi:hypothetical protein
VNIAFALLAHGSPRLVERLVRLLVDEGHKVALHYDLKSPESEYQRLVEAFAGCDGVRFARRVEVRWAEWSIVEATLNCLDAIAEGGWQPDYVYHLSGMDYPIRPSSDLIGFLERNRGKEFIESVPADRVRWAKTGPQTERYEYRFYFNWREQRRRCEFLFWLQKKLRLKRKFIRGLPPYMGSQWWVLTWDTLRRVRELAREPDILAFFRTVLVPDEIFFQTMVRHLVPASNIVSRTLTLYQFSDYGLPLVYYTDHIDYLTRQPFFMARKMSPRHPALRNALDACWRGETTAQPFVDSEIGIVGPEYDARRTIHRDGVPGRPVPGRAPRPRYGDLDRLAASFFVVLGSSTAELRLVHNVLKRQPGLLCHGQLLHPKRIEFADNAAATAGYGAADMRVRSVSVANFISDVVRSEKRRLPGFLLRWGQGGHLVEILPECPQARLIVLRGDPLIGFEEELLGVEPLLDSPAMPADFDSLAPAVLADRFNEYLERFRNFGAWLSAQAAQTVDFAEIDCVGPAPPSAWLTQIEDCLGVSLGDVDSDELAREWALLADRRAFLLERLPTAAAALLEPAIARAASPEIAVAAGAGAPLPVRRLPRLALPRWAPIAERLER